MPDRITDHRGQVDTRLLLGLFDRLPAMIAYWDHEARNVIANAAYIEWFGFDPRKMRGIHISEVLGAEVYAKNLPFIEAVLGGEEQLFDRTLIDQAGRVRHTQASYVPDFVDGVVQGFFVLVTDVTPRVEAQRAADEAQAVAQLGSWEYDVATGGVVWSRNLYDIVGIEQNDEPVTLTTLAEHIHPDDRPRVLANIEEASRVGDPYTITYRIVRSDGNVREVISNGRPHQTADGVTVGIIGTLQDVTDSNEAARETARINAQLLAANRLNSDVIGMLAHDTRNSLTAARGYLEVLETSWPALAEDVRLDYVGRARKSTVRLTRMIGGVSALAAVDSGDIRVNAEPVDILGVLEDIAGEVDIEEFVVSRVGHRDELKATCDPVHFDQIVGNLLGNAHRYGVEPVTAAVSEVDGVLEVAISDAGGGVPEAALDALFDRYAHTGEAQESARGTGFGLYISAELAQANGGDLTYRPAEAGKPHAFVLSLPLAGSAES